MPLGKGLVFAISWSWTESSELRILASFRINASSHRRIVASSHRRIFASSHLRIFASSLPNSMTKSDFKPKISMDSACTTSARTPGRPLLRKSHSGCRECRLRKVKCDEIKPACSNCRRRYQNIQRCEWNTDASSKKRGPPAPPRQLPEDVAVRSALTCTADVHITTLNLNFNSYPSSMEGTGKWRAVELRLMYHYATVVSRTMPECNGTTIEAWQETIPQLSFESELVLSAMLTFSALHLHAHSGNDADVALAFQHYLNRTLVNHRQALANSSERISDQIWFSAVLLCHIYWLVAHQARPNESYKLPLEAFKIIEGVSLLFEQKISALAQQGHMWFSYNPMPSIAPELKLSATAQMHLRDIAEDLAALLDAFNVSEMPDNDRRIYEGARDYVLYHYRAFFSSTNPLIFQWFIGFVTVRCHPEYRKKLEQHDPLAMALMARMLVMVCKLESQWWMKGEGDFEVMERDILGIRNLMPTNLRRVMDWPYKVLKGEIALTRD